MLGEDTVAASMLKQGKAAPKKNKRDFITGGCRGMAPAGGGEDRAGKGGNSSRKKTGGGEGTPDGL
ncbi:hypothetical protein llg_27140 [Luteolibacter sp. LG18]|nr:hypothetical protein llg_27140 [Luteolibacter sp. LG18]